MASLLLRSKESDIFDSYIIETFTSRVDVINAKTVFFFFLPMEVCNVSSQENGERVLFIGGPSKPEQ